jgi:hypothetical protein
MKRLLVSLEDERYEDLRRLAFEKNASMADLLRHAMEDVFEEALDDVRIRRGLEEHAKDPSGTMTIEEYIESRGLTVSGGASPKRAAGTRRAAS